MKLEVLLIKSHDTVPENKSIRERNRAFSYDVMAAMLVIQNKGMAAMVVYQINPPGIELFFYANSLFCSSIPIWLLVTRVKTL